MSVNKHGCPVCGFPEFEALDESGCVTYDICPSCGCEAGCEYEKDANQERLRQLRDTWLNEKKGAWWNSRMPPPPSWSPLQQLRAAGLHE